MLKEILYEVIDAIQEAIDAMDGKDYNDDLGLVSSERDMKQDDVLPQQSNYYGESGKNC